MTRAYHDVLSFVNMSRLYLYLRDKSIVSILLRLVLCGFLHYFDTCLHYIYLPYTCHFNLRD